MTDMWEGKENAFRKFGTKRTAKMANLEGEIERIVAKEGGEDGLSEGQRRQVERNMAIEDARSQHPYRNHHCGAFRQQHHGHRDVHLQHGTHG